MRPADLSRRPNRSTVTMHWEKYHPCSYLWSLAGLDAYVKDRGPGADEALAHYDPRRNQKPATAEETT